jgi:hypothetical protein
VKDGDRRKLIILAEARACATDASAVLQRLRVNLDQLKGARELPSGDPRVVACQVAQELVDRLIGLREWISGQISEVPS